MDLVSNTSYFANPFRFNPIHQDMIYLYSREESYKNWPQQLSQKPKHLARNGFFYKNVGDQVTCFYCGITLKQWLLNDDIETEHIKWEPTCLFAKMVSSKSWSSTYFDTTS